MACACNSKKTTAANTTYLWTAADGSSSKVYSSEIEAAAKVQRVGGSYVPNKAA